MDMPSFRASPTRGVASQGKQSYTLDNVEELVKVCARGGVSTARHPRRPRPQYRGGTVMGCASSSPLPSGPGPLGPPDDTVAGKVRQTVTEMADALPVQDLLDGVTHAKDGAMHKLHGKSCSLPTTD